MPQDIGNCPYCNATNAYSNRTCSSCKEPLPWAAWVEATAAPSAALGASYDPAVKAGGEAVSDGIPLLSGPQASRLLFIALPLLLMLVGGYLAINRLAQGLKPAATAISTPLATDGKSGSPVKGTALKRQITAHERKLTREE